MAFHVAFLRGMNLGGRRITNANLVAACEELGFEGVSAYRASGNVLFEATDRSEGELVAAIEEGLRESLGYEVPTFVRDGAEVHGIAAFDPFDLDLVAASKGKLQIALLSAAPSEADVERVRSVSTDSDRLTVVGRELYWLPSGGIADSDLDLDRIELGPMTVRTKGTIEGIAAKLGG